MLKRNGTALLLALVIVAPGITRAQAVDSTRKFSLFGGAAISDGSGSSSLLSEVATGGSADFRMKSFPLLLRANIAFSEAGSSFVHSPLHFGTLSLDAVTRPACGLLGIHPYLLGGLGVATRAQFTRVVGDFQVAGDQVITTYRPVSEPRLNWAYLEGGAGLEFGKFFLEGRVQQPAAMDGPTRKPVSFGIRF